MIKTTRLMFSYLTILLPNSLVTSKNYCFANAISFEELASKCSVYVDKTLFIKDFIETNFTLLEPKENIHFNTSVHVLRLTYPRKWGKTMNLKMLEDFLQMEVDHEGNQKNLKDTWAYRFFVLGQWTAGSRFKLNIAEHEDVLDDHLANYPVIYLTFSSVNGTKYDEIVLGVKHAIAEAFKAHLYMIQVYERRMQDPNTTVTGKNQTQKDLGQFQAYLSSTVSEGSTLVGIKFLSEQLHNHFGKKVFVLLDDHDQPLRSVFNAGISDPKLIQAISLFLTRVILCSFYYLCYYYRPSLAVEKAIVTGVMRVVPFVEDAKLVHGMDYNQEFSVFNDKFNSYFGFNEEEVKVVLKLSKINKKLADRAKKWYRGYTVLDIQSEAGAEKIFNQRKRCFVDVYNPYDIEQFVVAGKISSYWAESGSVPFLSELLRNKMAESSITSLLNGKKVEVELYELVFTSEELQQLTKMLDPAMSAHPYPELHGHEADLFHGFLFGEGYLTLHKDEHEFTTRVRIPNEEIKLDMATKLLQYYTRAYRISLDVQDRVVKGFKYLVEEDSTLKFKKSLEALVVTFPKFTNQKNTSAENIVNSALNTVILTSRQVYEADSAIYLLEGERSRLVIVNTRPSIMLTLEKLQLGIVMQLMYNASENDLGQVKNYAKCIDKDKNIKNVRLLAINVLPNKSVEIKEERIRNRRFF